MYFEKPPLIELIAELRWLPVGVPGGGDGQPQAQQIQLAFLGASQSSEQLYMGFASRMGAKGFMHSERLLPQGFPGILFQPAYRYTESGTLPGRPVFQLGPGVFSAHITPPYRSWVDFRPFVETAVAALLDARQGLDGAAPFNNAAVRYVDCFTASFLRGMSSGTFLERILGIEMDLPDAISRHVAANKEITPAIQLKVPLTDDRVMEISLADGQTPSGSGLVMTSSVSNSVVLAPEQDRVMQFLDGAHQVISDMFVELTKKLHPIMEPKS